MGNYSDTRPGEWSNIEGVSEKQQGVPDYKSLGSRSVGSEIYGWKMVRGIEIQGL